jgi:spore maturation protein CgeE
MNYLQSFKKVEAAYLALYAKSEAFGNQELYYDEDNRLKYLHNFLYVKNNQIKLNELKNYEETSFKYGFVRFVLDDEVNVPEYLLSSDFTKEQSIYYMANIDEILIHSKIMVDLVRVVDVNDPFFSFLYKEDLAFGENYAKLNNIKTKKVLTSYQSDRMYRLILKNKIIGHIEVFTFEKIAKIEEFYVLEEYQGQGFGSAMLAQIVAVLKEEGIEYITLVTDANNQAQNLYKRVGFQEIGSHSSFIKKK